LTSSPFKTFNINAAIRQFQKVVKDVELSDDKIEKIYRKLESDWVPYIENTLTEIEEFHRFINLLAS
jgi:histidinol dehydrogenase